MAKNTCEVITSTFKALCIIATVSVITFWMHKCYIQDDDLCLVDYFSMESDEVSSPVLSLCFENRFSEEKLKKVSPNLNGSYYLEYLRGEAIDENLTRVDYEDVSFNIFDYIAYYQVRLNNGSKIDFYESSPYQNLIHETFNGFFLSKKYFVKCFGHSIRNEHRKDIQGITTYYNFPDGFGRHYISIHYPHQLLASVRNIRYFLNPIFDPKKKISQRWFDVHEMEILKRRNKRKYSCINFDDEFRFDEHVQLGLNDNKHLCRAPYQTLDKTRPVCSTLEAMRDATFIFNEDFDEKVHPCESMSNIRHEMQEIFIPGTKFSSINLMIPKKVRVVQQSKAIDTNSLIGYVGGYVGVLLGRYCKIDITCLNCNQN